jgi:hypothetical protein
MEVNRSLNENNQLVWNNKTNKITFFAFRESERSNSRRRTNKRKLEEAGERNGSSITSYFVRTNAVADPGSDVETLLDHVGDNLDPVTEQQQNRQFSLIKTALD